MRIPHKGVYATGRSVLFPLGGFITGWVAYRVVEDKGLISECYLRQVRLANLKVQLYLQQHVLPTSVTEKYGYPEDLLNNAIEQLKNANGKDERWTFDAVLRECDVPEQVAWLEEHISYDIPYFYIADLFNGWCNVHQNIFYRDNNTAPMPPSKKEDFASEVLCRGVVEKMLNGVFPYDVASRALCILAMENRDNAKLLIKLISPNDVLERYQVYLGDLKEKGSKDGDVIPSNVVAAATLGLLHAMNGASVYERKIPFLGRASTGPYPLLAQLKEDQWCRCFWELPSLLSTGCNDSTLALVGFISESFFCEKKK